MTDSRRVKILNGKDYTTGLIAYWMNRDQRVNDNWALNFAQELALKNKVPLTVVFNLTTESRIGTIRQYDFMIRGLQEVERKLDKLKIPFILLIGAPQDVFPKFILQKNVGAIVSDFSPLKTHREQKKIISKLISVPLYEVDAHNIVPCWHASNKLEYGAYTFRPKIQRLLPEFLNVFPKITKHPYYDNKFPSKVDWGVVYKSLKIEKSVSTIDWLVPGEKEALKVLEQFIQEKLNHYYLKRNNPVLNYQSNLSPYLHFGQISAQRVAYEIQKVNTSIKSVEAFLEELMVRRELSDNFCYYNEKYNSLEGFPEWSRKSLEKHRNDKRKIIYTRSQFEHANTHDLLWNAAQSEMLYRGKMHGYMRMYWAKKILEWSKSPEEAMATATFLNDKYELDGQDPNGYTGIAWSIGGVHDRAWGEREVFGKIRYMSYEGCKKKFDVKSYIEKNKIK